ncbi:hypothetical protein CFC21_105357 [Triticum aestivum]|uniref:Protein kinase domain-containing protein n=3 Tax=Triticum TaxID=4564 RepID=A0A9R1C5D4_TRITD|nr:hypothetical protein CFC21_105357 [Triticum aestivum]VAI92942.1 unnamed protein product [Triticum turgidum subsp. durum]
MASRRRPSPTTLVFLVLLYLYYAPSCAFSLSFNLNFSDPSAGSSIAVAGDAFISPSTLELTKNTRSTGIQNSVGRASYAHKVPLWSNSTSEMASFTTTFAFQITPDKDSLPLTGDGMAFFLGHFPSVIPRDSYGGSLGLLLTNTNGTGDGRIVAVEFDTFFNTRYGDINGNHVGIDINSVNSTASTRTTRPGKNLTSLHVMEATIKYQNDSKMLALDLLIDDVLYQLIATVDLRRYLPEEVAVGFSAATGDIAELHQILSWSFSSTLQLESKKEAAPPAQPLPIPSFPSTSSKNHKTLVPILVSVLVPLLFLVVCVAVVLGWRRHKKRRANEDSEEECDDRADLERGVAAGGPRRYVYHELVAATNNFAEEEKLGRGGFGSVYRGHLILTLAGAVGGDQDRREVAVKVLSAESSSQGEEGVRGRGEDHQQTQASQPCPIVGLVRQP